MTISYILSNIKYLERLISIDYKIKQHFSTVFREEAPNYAQYSSMLMCIYMCEYRTNLC